MTAARDQTHRALLREPRISLTRESEVEVPEGNRACCDQPPGLAPFDRERGGERPGRDDGAWAKPLNAGQSKEPLDGIDRSPQRVGSSTRSDDVIVTP